MRWAPGVPIISPRTTWVQAKSTAAALLHRDKDRWGVVKEGIKQKVQDVRPGEKDDR